MRAFPMKSAYELAMEKLRKKDAERGQKEIRLDEGQKAEIAEIRAFYKAKVAEREILFQADLRKARAAGDLDAARKIEDSYLKDRESLESQMESKVRKVRDRAGRRKGKP